MSDPVNLNNLRELTGGDSELEKELFKEFVSSGDESVKSIEQAYNASDNAQWYSATHAFKGISMNLGAEKLSEYCKIAQDSSEKDNESKKNILSKIKAEFEEVKKFLSNIS